MAKKLKLIDGTTLHLSEEAPADVQVAVAPNATITLNGQKVGLSDLRPGDVIQPSSGNPVTQVVASRP